MPQERFYIKRNSPFIFNSENKRDEAFALGLMLYIKNEFKHLYFEDYLDKFDFSATNNAKDMSSKKLFHNQIRYLLKQYNEEWNSDLMNFSTDDIDDIVINNFNKEFFVNGYKFIITLTNDEENKTFSETIKIIRS